LSRPFPRSPAVLRCAALCAPGNHVAVTSAGPTRRCDPHLCAGRLPAPLLPDIRRRSARSRPPKSTAVGVSLPLGSPGSPPPHRTLTFPLLRDSDVAADPGTSSWSPSSAGAGGGSTLGHLSDGGHGTGAHARCIQFREGE